MWPSASCRCSPSSPPDFRSPALTANDVLSPIPLGVALALVIGKPLGVFGFAFLGSALRLGRRPTGTTWLEMFGVALLCGLGFTMSLYLGGLAFGGGPGLAQSQVRLGVITGSLASVVAGGAVMAPGAQTARSAGRGAVRLKRRRLTLKETP